MVFGVYRMQENDDSTATSRMSCTACITVTAATYRFAPVLTCSRHFHDADCYPHIAIAGSTAAVPSGLALVWGPLGLRGRRGVQQELQVNVLSLHGSCQLKTVTGEREKRRKRPRHLWACSVPIGTNAVCQQLVITNLRSLLVDPQKF